MKSWSVRYKGHVIRVERYAFELRLLVDGELQDAGLADRPLNGVLRNGDGSGEPVKASLVGTFRVRCYIFVDHRLVE